MAPTIFIADDHEAVRQGLRPLISKHQGWVVCGETDNHRQTLQAVSELRPAIVIRDPSIIEGVPFRKFGRRRRIRSL